MANQFNLNTKYISYIQNIFQCIQNSNNGSPVSTIEHITHARNSSLLAQVNLVVNTATRGNVGYGPRSFFLRSKISLQSYINFSLISSI